jgi:hypothetical protein
MIAVADNRRRVVAGLVTVVFLLAVAFALGAATTSSSSPSASGAPQRRLEATVRRQNDALGVARIRAARWDEALRVWAHTRLAGQGPAFARARRSLRAAHRRAHRHAHHRRR